MNKALETIIKENKGIKNKIDFKNIVFVQSRSEASKILDYHKVFTPPAIILVDNNNQVLFKASYDFSFRQIKLLKKRIADLIK